MPLEKPKFTEFCPIANRQVAAPMALPTLGPRKTGEFCTRLWDPYLPCNIQTQFKPEQKGPQRMWNMKTRWQNSERVDCQSHAEGAKRPAAIQTVSLQPTPQ